VNHNLQFTSDVKLYNHSDFVIMMQLFLSHFWLLSQFFINSSQLFTIEHKKFILSFIEEVKSQFKFLFHLSTFIKTQRSHLSIKSYHSDVLSLKVRDDFKLCQFAEKQKHTWNYNFTFICHKLTNLDSQILKMSEIVLSLCHQCTQVSTKLIRNIEEKNKNINIVMITIN